MATHPRHKAGNRDVDVGQSLSDTWLRKSIKGSRFVWLGDQIAHRRTGDKLLEANAVLIKYTMSKDIIISQILIVKAST